MAYEVTIGLEVHIQLRTRSKLFCPCPVSVGATPNQNICPICVGWPGTLPSLNRGAVFQGLRLAMALGAKIQSPSYFSRKHYFYGDLPKGYQITQFDVPLALGGQLPTAFGHIILERLHLEEDAGKTVHHPKDGVSLVDLNRAGVPLIEVVTTPCMTHPDEAVAFAKGLHRLVRHLGVGDADLSQGNFRMDANISLCRSGAPRGPKVEIKNLNSFRFLKKALFCEIARQEHLLEKGDVPAAETRGYNPKKNKTFPQRLKEGAMGYLFMPEPDLSPLTLDPAWVAGIEKEMPELPWALESRLVASHGVSQEQAHLLAEDPALAIYFETSNRWTTGGAQLTVNVILTDLLSLYPIKNWGTKPCPIPPEALGTLIEEVRQGRLTREAMKMVMQRLEKDGGSVVEIIEKEGLAQVNSAKSIGALVFHVLETHNKEVADYLAGNTRIFGFLMGQIMSKSQGRLAGDTARKHLETALKEMDNKGEG